MNLAKAHSQTEYMQYMHPCTHSVVCDIWGCMAAAYILYIEMFVDAGPGMKKHVPPHTRIRIYLLHFTLHIYIVKAVIRNGKKWKLIAFV